MSGGADSASALASRRLYLCTPDRPDLERFVADCIAGGVDVVQLRDKVLAARPLIEAARRVARVCADHGVPFILNDRPDLALEAGADGVHVGQDDTPAVLARRILGPHALIGLSTHAPAELRQGLTEPVDYVSTGPVVPTPTKEGRLGTGTSLVSLASTLAPPGRGLPFFVTGGVTPEAVGELTLAGARRFVVVRYLTQATEPRLAAVELRHAIDAAWERDGV